MAIKPYLKRPIEKIGEFIVATIEYKQPDGTVVLEEEQRTNQRPDDIAAWLREGAYRRADNLNKLADPLPAIVVGEIPAPTVPPPTAAELAEREYLRRRNLFFAAKREGEGFKSAILVSAKYKALETWLSNNWKPEYTRLD